MIRSTRRIAAGCLLVSAVVSSDAVAKAVPEEIQYRGLVSLGVHYHHSSDLLLLETYGSGTAYSLDVRVFRRNSPLGLGLSYMHNTRKGRLEHLGSLVTDELTLSLLYRVATFTEPVRILPFIGLGAGLVYFQETTLPTFVFRFDEESSFSMSGKFLPGYFAEAGIPVAVSRRFGVLIRVLNEFALLPAEYTNFNEAFQVGGIHYGLEIFYAF